MLNKQITFFYLLISIFFFTMMYNLVLYQYTLSSINITIIFDKAYKLVTSFHSLKFIIIILVIFLISILIFFCG